MATIDYRLLKRATVSLQRKAHREFPKATGFDTGKATIAARLDTLDVDVSGALKFAQELLDKDHYALFWVHAVNKRQLRVLRAALLAGIAIGIQAERMRNGR